ncbi:hypothetical protein V6N13_059046 [Hibiscus sabdariffa]|uniref:Uncharacterized protein n=1 Tax=Hibiscus sabdariffa TaxID=183260 RepID=A0ABR2GEA1_9ROSI
MAFLHSFGDCSALEHIDISGKKLFGDIARTASSSDNINLLNLSINRFSSQIQALPTSVLQYLLAENNFQGEIPLHLTQTCSSLVEMDLSYNNLFGLIPSSFGSCFSLESFHVSNNSFTGKIPIEIFRNRSSLKELGLAFNFFSLVHFLNPYPLFQIWRFWISVQTISQGQFQFQFLFLYVMIPPELEDWKSLIWLDLNTNNLNETVPNVLFKQSG